ncbi:MAG: nucleoside 2-deoxyribosyltransferase [Hafnia sp.]
MSSSKPLSFMKAIDSIYLAGFDVFRQDSIEHGERLKALASEHGLVGLYPLDNKIPGINGDGVLVGDTLVPITKHEIAKKIAFANIELIKRCDALVANANSFRGHEPDSGTMFEIGYAIALGKPVYLYLSDLRPMIDKVPNVNGVDEQGYTVEDFNFPVNLMMAGTADAILGSYAEALDLIVTRNRLLAEMTL